MNYMWDLLIKTKELGISKESIKFSPAKVYSPYMELSNENINFNTIEQNIEVNPNYRFYEIFKDMFNINNEEDVELRNTLFDILMHFLADIDIKQGMNKKEYYVKFLLKDIENNMLGSAVKEKIKLFNNKEKIMLVHNILKLYKTGEALYLLKDMMRKIFKKSMVYANCEEKDELLFFIGEEKTEEKQGKLELIKEIFLPIKFHTEVYWKIHFGVIGVEETMKIDNIMLY